MAWTPHPKQADLIRKVLIDHNKRGVALFGRQTGKTMSAVQLAKLAAIFEQGTYFMVFATYNQAEQVVWKQYIHLIEPALIKEVNKTDLSITFNHIKADIKMPGGEVIHVEHDESLPPSRIRLLGSDNAESHRGNKAHGIIFDEYQSQNPDNWATVYQPMFTTTNGWALFMGTPNGFNHFYDLVMDAKKEDDWFLLEATWRDNPFVKPEAILQAKREAERKGNLNGFLQEYELEFRKVDRAVYGEFDRNVHVIKPSEVPFDRGGQYWASIDFGYTQDHPMAINFVFITYDGTWYIYDEIHETDNVRLDDIIEVIKQKTADVHLQGLIPDMARVDLVDYMASKALPIIKHRKPGVSESIPFIKELLHPRSQIIGDPKPMLFITSNCRETILNFELYKYKEPKKDRPTSAEPVKHHDDHLDGLRYLRSFLKLGHFKNEKLNTQSTAMKNTGEFGLML